MDLESSDKTAANIVATILYWAIVLAIVSVLFILVYGNNFSHDGIVAIIIAITSMAALVLFALCTLLLLDHKGIFTGALGGIATLIISQIASYYNLYIWNSGLDSGITISFYVIFMCGVFLSIYKEIIETN